MIVHFICFRFDLNQDAPSNYNHSLSQHKNSIKDDRKGTVHSIYLLFVDIRVFVVILNSSFYFRHIIRSYDCREMEPLPKSYENGVEEELSILDPNPFDIYFSLLLPFSFNQCVCWRDVCKVIFHLFNQVKMILIIKSCWVKNK